MTNDNIRRIVIVGGGAGGLELATKLGNRLGRRQRAQITLIDSGWTHIWKPLLHEVAAGTLDVGEHQIEYLAQARRHHFRFRLGRVDGLDRAARQVWLAPSYNDAGLEITPRRSFPYDILVFAVGSVSNDFGIEGVDEHCLFLDSTREAQSFQQHLLGSLLRAHSQGAPIRPGQLDVVIVGGGATGIELAAQMHCVTRRLAAYGLEEMKPDENFHMHLIEAAPRLVGALPERVSSAVHARLEALGVRIYTNERVVSVATDGVRTASAEFIPAALKIWCAGIKAPDFLRQLDGLETNHSQQLIVDRTLRTSRDDNIYALGDCAACSMDNDELVPPRAQAAHQQASYLARTLTRRLSGRQVSPYRYRDYGALISLGRYSTVGQLMGHLTGSVMISGLFARLTYLSLYQMHQIALHGWLRTMVQNLANRLRRGLKPEIKLH